MTTSSVIGVDIASEHFDVAYHGSTVVLRYANQAKAIKTWLKTVPVGASIAVEATGTYHLLVADLAHAAGFTVYVLNPQDVANYRKSIGTRAKTDRIDAQLIARYIAREHQDLHPYVPAPDSHRRVMRLLHRRAQLVKTQIALRLSASEMTDLKAATLAIVAQIEALLQRIDRKIRAVVKAEAATAHQVRHLQSINGIGPLTATALTLTYQRHPFTGVEAFIAFLGLDPRARESGKYQGRRSLSKRGDGEIRRLLFCAAQSATRTSLWRPFYEAQRVRGRHHVEAIMILARRLVKVAFALLRHDCEFRPELVKVA
jgi:transposase